MKASSVCCYALLKWHLQVPGRPTLPAYDWLLTGFVLAAQVLDQEAEGGAGD